MFPSIYLNCSDAPDALYPHLKKLLLFAREVHIMNANPVLLEERAGINSTDFLRLCTFDSRTEQPPAIHPICRKSFIDKELRKDRADLVNDEFDETFYSCLSALCGPRGRILDKNSYSRANHATEDVFKEIGDAQFGHIESLSKSWLDQLPRNRRDRMLSVADRERRQLEWIFVDTVYQELVVKDCSGADEHAPAPMDVEALMFLNAIFPSKSAQNKLIFPSEKVNWEQVRDLIDGLFPRDAFSSEQLLEMSAEQIFSFRHRHSAELGKLYTSILKRARDEDRIPFEVAKHYARDAKEDLETLVSNIETGVNVAIALGSLFAAGPWAAALGYFSSAAAMLGIRTYFPRVQSEMTYRIARHLAPNDKKIIFSSCLFQETIG